MKIVLLAILMLSNMALAANCTVVGPDGYSGPITPDVKVQCGSVVPTPVPPPPVPVPVAGCAASQLSAPWNLTRQCGGFVTYQPGAPLSGVPLSENLAEVLGGGTWLNYAGEQWGWWIPVTTGSYISLAFTPTAPGSLNLNANPTYGGGGIISVSATPGDFSSRAVCVRANYGSNNLAIGDPSACPIVIGRTYYVNIADVKPDGSPHCWGVKPWLPQTCAASVISYTAN